MAKLRWAWAEHSLEGSTQETTACCSIQDKEVIQVNLALVPRQGEAAHSAHSTSSIHQPPARVPLGVRALQQSHDLSPQQGQVQVLAATDVAGHLVKLVWAVLAHEGKDLPLLSRGQRLVGSKRHGSIG